MTEPSLEGQKLVYFARIFRDYRLDAGKHLFLLEALLDHFGVPLQEKTTLCHVRKAVFESDYEKFRRQAASEYHVLGKIIPKVLQSYPLPQNVGNTNSHSVRFNKLFFIASKVFSSKGDFKKIPSEYDLIRAEKPRTEDTYYLLPGGLVKLILDHQEPDAIFLAYQEAAQLSRLI